MCGRKRFRSDAPRGAEVTRTYLGEIVDETNEAHGRAGFVNTPMLGSVSCGAQGCEGRERSASPAGLSSKPALVLL